MLNVAVSTGPILNGRREGKKGSGRVGARRLAGEGGRIGARGLAGEGGGVELFSVLKTAEAIHIHLSIPGKGQVTSLG